MVPKGQDYKETLLAKDANLRRWYNNVKRGSVVTAEVNLRRIGLVCKLFDTTPSKLARMNVKQATDFTMDLVSKLEDEGKQPKYVLHFAKVMKSWFAHNGIKIEQKIQVSEHASTPSKVAQEQSPTPDQLRKVLNAADLKQKVESALVAFAGLRIESVGDYLGKDGLKVRDMPDLTVDNASKTVKLSKVPALVVVRPSLSKAGHQYFSFLPEEGCEYVKQLLEHRMKTFGEKIDSDSSIVTSLKWHDREGRHITSRRVGSSIKVAIKSAGYEWRPYILRTYFDTRIMMAEADGLIIRDWRVFWMGHSGDIEHVYTLNKRLPVDLVDKMRSAFAKASDKYLITVSLKTTSIDAVKAQFNAQFLLISGYTEEELEGLGDLSQIGPTDIQRLVQDKQKMALGLNGNTQKVVPMADVKDYILQGWEYVRDLQQEAIIRLPHR